MKIWSGSLERLAKGQHLLTVGSIDIMQRKAIDGNAGPTKEGAGAFSNTGQNETKKRNNFKVVHQLGSWQSKRSEQMLALSALPVSKMPADSTPFYTPPTSHSRC